MTTKKPGDYVARMRLKAQKKLTTSGDQSKVLKNNSPPDHFGSRTGCLEIQLLERCLCCGFLLLRFSAACAAAFFCAAFRCFLLSFRADELEFSVRSQNCLQNADIKYIGELVQKSEQEMLRTKNFGHKSLNEIKEILKEMGLELGMKIDHFPSREEIDARKRAAEKEPV